MLLKRFRIALVLMLLLIVTSLMVTMPTAAQNSCDPEVDLSGSIQVVGNQAVGVIQNTSANCSYDVGLASYYKFENPTDPSIPNQELAYSSLGVIGPNSSLELRVTLPDCSTQIDLFYGELIYAFTAENNLYAERLLDYEHRNTYPCDPGNGDEGCTPGYWKNHNGYWSVKGMRYVDVFFGSLGYLGGGDPALLASVYAAIGDLTLDNALSVRGNRYRWEALARASAAAILSASHPEVDYPLVAEEVVARVRTAWSAWLAGDYVTTEMIKNELDGFNNLGCDLGRFAYP